MSLKYRSRFAMLAIALLFGAILSGEAYGQMPAVGVSGAAGNRLREAMRQQDPVQKLRLLREASKVSGAVFFIYFRPQVSARCSTPAIYEQSFNNGGALMATALEEIDRKTIDHLDYVGTLNIQLWSTLRAIKTALPLVGNRYRWQATVRQMLGIGYDALPMVSLMAVCAGFILALQGASELRRFGALHYVIDLVTVGFTRESYMAANAEIRKEWTSKVAVPELSPCIQNTRTLELCEQGVR